MSEPYWSDSATSEYLVVLGVCIFSVMGMPKGALEPAVMFELPGPASARALPMAITLPSLSYRVAIMIALVALSRPSFLATA